MLRRFSRRFYCRPTPVVARALLGKVLVVSGIRARIVECEAYLGAEDLASHARFGPTPRNEIMFAPGGFSYVYLCYGIHHMFNVVTDREGNAGAVLIRAVTIVDRDATRRQGLSQEPRTDGPGKLTRVLGIAMHHHRLDLTTSEHLYISAGRGSKRVTDDNIQTGPRIGIAYAGEWVSAPLRFFLA